METSTPLINAIVNNALFHSNFTYINQMPPQTVHILCFFGRLAAPDFIMKYIRSELFGS